MKLYYIFNSDHDFDLSYFNDYKVAGSAKTGFVIIKFDESETERIVELYDVFFNKNSFIKVDKSTGYCFFGADGYFYNYIDGKLSKTDIKGIYTFFACIYLASTRNKKLYKTHKHTERRSLQFSESTIIKKLSALPYKAYEFYCKEHNITFKYRLKKAFGADKPLVVYMAGGSSLGYDNFKQMYECQVGLHRQLKKYDCSVFVPQSPCASYTIKPTQSDYIDAVRQLLDKVCDEVKADKKRIYLVGTSGGGWHTWEMIYRSPEYFACGMPVMGNFLFRKDKNDIEFERFLSTPIWVAHSADDNNVIVDSDDYCVEKLRELGADIRYTRWEKYGHKMQSKFYKREPWAEWMFKQVRK